jgi:hypothetical protein
MVFGTHITPIPVETMRPYPALDIGLVGEPDLTLRDLIDHLERKIDERPPLIQKLINEHDPEYRPALNEDGTVNMHEINGIVWRKGDEIILNKNRPFIKNLDDLPIPLHEMLPYKKYVMPLMKGPFTFMSPVVVVLLVASIASSM